MAVKSWRPAVGPGWRSLVALDWLARVGPAPVGALETAMGWARSTTWSHLRRLVDAGYVAKVERPALVGSLWYATQEGIKWLEPRPTVLAVSAPPAPSTWAHHDAVAWTAAWLSAHGNAVIGGRELLAEARGLQGQLEWFEHEGGGVRRRRHRPDLAAAVGDAALPIEVELTAKSHERLRSILSLHLDWMTEGRARAVIYVCGDRRIAARVQAQAALLGLEADGKRLRVELLETIKKTARDTRSPELSQMADEPLPQALSLGYR
jgi:hypothetical protein